jgi:recombination protein RecA
MAKKKKKEENIDSIDPIEIAAKELEKQFGTGTLIRLNDRPLDIDSIPTDSISLNKAVGIGGIPVGRVIEIFGKEASGKTTLATNIMMNAQKKFPDKGVAIIDTEHAYSTRYASSQGMDSLDMWVAQPASAEEALDIIDRLISSGGFSVICLDSTAALVPKIELEGGFSDNTIGVNARLLSKSMRKFKAKLNESGTTLIYISQLRSKINTMGYGPKDDTTGGNATKFYSELRLRTIKTKTIKPTSSNSLTGIEVEVQVVKNKVAAPYLIAEYTIYDHIGICGEREILDLVIENGIVEKTGNTHNFEEQKIVGESKAINYLLNNSNVVNELKEELIKKEII